MRLPISIFIMAGAFLAGTVVLYLMRFYTKRKKFRPSLSQDLRRSPGQSLLAELDLINEDLRRYCIFAVLSPVTIFAVHLLLSYVIAADKSGVRLMVAIGGGLILCIFSVYKVVLLLNERKTLRLAYAEKSAVGRELEQFTRDGFRVYHDFPAETFSIDHIVVGPKGVFTVKTKTHSKPAAKNRIEDATVAYDGRMLYFPREEDFRTIEEARQQADWLSDWLGSAIGEPIAARAIIALPGWLVKRTSAEGIPVVNLQQFSSLFKHIKPRLLSDPMIRRIIQQLDKK
jgi:hypothetical protein